MQGVACSLGRSKPKSLETLSKSGFIAPSIFLVSHYILLLPRYEALCNLENNKFCTNFTEEANFSSVSYVISLTTSLASSYIKRKLQIECVKSKMGFV